MKAIIWKESVIIGRRLKSLMISSIFTLVFLMSVGYIRSLLSIQSMPDSKGEIIENMILYICITSGYMMLMSLLRFWQEKSQKTIETFYCFLFFDFIHSFFIRI
jgi:hypothetical protein